MKQTTLLIGVNIRHNNKYFLNIPGAMHLLRGYTRTIITQTPKQTVLSTLCTRCICIVKIMLCIFKRLKVSTDQELGANQCPNIKSRGDNQALIQRDHIVSWVNSNFQKCGHSPVINLILILLRT